MIDDPKPDPRPNIGWLLKTNFDAYHNLAVKHVHDAGFGGVSLTQAQIIAHLTELPIRIVDLAQRFGVSKQAMSVMVNDLIHGGFLTQETDPKDKRAKLLTLTDKGKELKKTARSTRKTTEDAFLSRLPDKDAETLIRLLQSLLIQKEP